MDDVRKWLSRLKLDHLAKVFEVNQVDFDTLRLLSDGDLRDMQIPLGPRKKLLTAIKRLIDESGKVLAPISGERSPTDHPVLRPGRFNRICGPHGP
ncbi:SAM domain-containing protein (plasmid) [Phyllobacterium sp. A18/5-2]|uniref:SAM domain-containing protein n=1 Tax=Phyllobacterium sp. A18/5-2 TaxID=2978392 RepID=UPI0021C901A5|nr:SAM domain-containing protein [Phyllobacterium sp. A18/5-2]UXN67395.1 SAM domain-containing protein [Phyllobacterium sp. A18/5-2]